MASHRAVFKGRNRGTIVRRPRGAPMTAGRASFMTRVGDLVSADAERSNNAGVLQPPVKVPPPASCYACDGAVVGVRDRRPEGGQVEAACARHSDMTLAELWHRGAA